MFITAYVLARPQDVIAPAGGVRRWDVLVESLAKVTTIAPSADRPPKSRGVMPVFGEPSVAVTRFAASVT